MSNYKLTYFNFKGLGEPIRMLLTYGGVDFKDHRIEMEDWPALKSTMPMEQMPVLEIDGKVYHQSIAIARYLAKKFALYGRDDLEAMSIDGSVADIEDFRQDAALYFREKDEDLKAKYLKNVETKSVFFLNKFEERAKKNGGYFVGSKLTWADIHFTCMIELVSTVLKRDLLLNYPTLTKLYDNVRSHPKLKDYIQKRPKTHI
ncbi:glutathione S-transferase-like [Trichogramma pretiosum]|uniref:glutathione S-transferase-like n=1 Tax=Trichogramma pretiosum TaxID=7493 RepID=UPI0006C9A8F0|nr:glutathione S-transferase-like [Trichogramma pretiosum]